jgi:16S rRNA (adenine1518-N6/adenine1519-N6)-dimethyltransferase
MTSEVAIAPALPPLRDVIQRHGLDPRKSLGQNFLLDPRLVARIAHAAGTLDGVNVIEVGPGPGGLTRALLAAGAATVTAIERDDRCVAALAELEAAYPGRLRVVPADALAIDPATLVDGPSKIVANLPYNIATPLLTGWLARIQDYASLTLMFQKEVAERITARPRTKDYGRLSILAQWLSEPRQVFDIPPGAFFPPPKVTSTVVHFTPRAAPEAAELADVEKVTAAAFGQRRKMLRSSLRSLGADTDALIAAAGIEPTARAEELPVAAFCTLARLWAGMRT